MIRFVFYPFFKLYIFLFKGRAFKALLNTFSFFSPITETQHNESPITFRQWFFHRIMGPRSGPYWPMHKTSTIAGSWRNVLVGIDAAPGISPGCYIQALGKIYIGDYAQIAPNVGIISANHFMLDIRKHLLGEIRIGAYSRIGMGSVILPGVTLGDFTTVSSGSVVTKSFPEGYCVIGGNPARIIEDYSSNEKLKQKFVRYRNDNEYNGFIPAQDFEKFRKEHLLV
jgi:carbonic anhydrase/acetyltransferase-like protein (isoleucine patch superfamily)